MKIVLREHVEHLGDRGEVVSVAPGYARNYLIPKAMAYLATPGNVKVLEQQRRVWEVKESKEIAESKAMAAQLSQIELTVTKKAGESGTLYGSVTTPEIAELLAGKGVTIDRRRIVLNEPIKALGSFEIPIKLRREVAAKIKLEVVGEEVAE